MNKYDEIVTELRRRITSGEYKQGEMLPDQVALAEEFGVSRMTLKKAMDILAMEGLLFRKRGVGTFVIKNALWNSSNYRATEYSGLTAQFPDKKVESQIVSFEIQFPTPELQELLMLESTDAVYHLVRLRIIDQQPYILEDTYFVAKLVKNLTEEVIYASIYEYIRSNLNLKIGGAYRKIHADVSNQLDQTYLGCDEHTPVLEVEQVVYLTNGTPFEYSKSRNRFDTRSYTITDVLPH